MKLFVVLYVHMGNILVQYKLDDDIVGKFQLGNHK